MRKIARLRATRHCLIALAVFVGQISVTLAQNAEPSSSPEGMTMFILFPRYRRHHRRIRHPLEPVDGRRRGFLSF